MHKLIVCAAAACLITTAACGRKPEPAPAPAHLLEQVAAQPHPPPARQAVEKLVADAVTEQTCGKAGVTFDGDNVQVHTDHGNIQIASGKAATLPDNFPQDIPLYPGTTVSQVISTTASVHLTLTGTAAPPAVVDFYRDAFARAGWGKDMDVQTGGNDMLTFVKGPRRVAVMVTRMNAETLISLTVAKP